MGATNLNRASSRSHAILTIEASIVDPVANISAFLTLPWIAIFLKLVSALTGKINLVDLAGSENNKVSEEQSMLGGTNVIPQLTGNDPSRMAESSAINKSLSVLGQVVHALNQGAVSLLDNWLVKTR